MNQRALITGSSGFIGQWVVEEMSRRGYTLFGLDVRSPPSTGPIITHYTCDICDRAAVGEVFERCRPELVVHLAARTDLNERHDLRGYATNIDGVRNVLCAIRSVGSVHRVVVASTQLVHRLGERPRTSEDYSAETLYGQSKIETERVTRAEDGGGAEWCIVRPTSVWGPRMIPHYQNMLRLIQRGLYFHCGSGELWKSYSYVGNIAWQIAQLLKASASLVHGRTFYLADYAPLSLRAYTEALARELGARKIPTMPLPLARFLARIGDLAQKAGVSYVPLNSERLRNIRTEYVYDVSQTEMVCGGLPYTFEDGVKATATWWKELRANGGA